jgi:hypothetical protein
MSVRSGIRFYEPERFVEVDIGGVDAIRAELEKIAATNPPRPDVTRLVDELELFVGDLDKSGPAFTPDDQQRALLLRATDHLRNLGYEGDALELRGALCGNAQPISYRLIRGAIDPPLGFTSYSLSYDFGERLVDARRSEYRITNVIYGDPIAFEVEEWRPAE